MTTQQKHHFHSIDLLRGLAALTVAFYHYTDYFLPKMHPLSISFAHGYLGVEAFFVISGLVVPYSLAQKHYSIRQFGTQLVSRIIRIEPAYWASIVLMLLKDAGVWYFRANKLIQLEPYNLFLHIFHANAVMHEHWLRGIYWTLAIDWQFYIIILVFFALFNRREWWIRYPIYALFAFAHWYFPYEWLPYHIASFGAGVVLFHYYRGHIDEKELAIVLPAMLLMHYRGFDWRHCLATAIPCAIILFVNAEWKWAKFLGKTSYSFYLTHVVTGWLLLDGATEIAKDDGWFMGTAIIVAVAFSIWLSYYFYRWVEEPTLAWAKNWHKWVKKH
ncbi:MAG: acyltransferase [Saprospiraceae bacterium]|nr:acyltransferase [Saprospiraceae bacterium]